MRRSATRSRAATRGDRVAAPETVDATAAEALRLAETVFPKRWREAAETADFDVIAATLDRVQAAAAQGEWGRAEQARLEAYGVFELGPEQRLRGIAPSVFQKVETLFWYGDGEVDGLVQLLKRKASAAELEQTRLVLDEALADAEARVGAGAGSRASVVANSAIIVFREGLEAVLILAALMASLVGARRGLRRPLLIGVALRARGERRHVGRRPDRSSARSQGGERSSRPSSRSSRSRCCS